LKKLLLFGLIVLSASLLTKNAKAATYQWWGGTGTWNVSGNWLNMSTGFFSGYPGSGVGDVAYFNSVFTNNVTLSANLPNAIIQVQAQAYSACKITINSGITLNVSNGLAITGTYGGSYDGITFAGLGSAVIGGASAFTYYATLTIGASNTVTFPAGSSISMANSYCGITNNGTLKFTGTLASGVTVTFADYGTLANTGTMTATYTTITSANINPTVSNTNSFTLTSSTIQLGGQSGVLTNSGTLNATSSTFALSANNTAINNTKTFTATLCPINLTGQAAAINNTTATGSFLVNACPIVLSTQNQCNITNGASATFLASGGSSISISSYQGYIINNGNFYSGTSNSACPITLSSQGSYITNSGTFYVGSTSGINLTGYQGLVTNNPAGFFIFQSDTYGSAYVGAIPTAVPASASGQFVGTFQIQRYISGGSAAYRGYRLFSSPVYASTDASSNHIYSLNYVKASALVTGSASGGFDKTGNPSLYLNRENIAVSNATFVSGNFRGVSSILSAPTYSFNGEASTYSIPVGNGFLFFFRGDRTTNLANKYTPGTSAESVIMTASGTLNTMQVIVHPWYTPASANLMYTTTAGNTTVRGYNMVGNPYASSIDWETFQTTTSTTGIYAPVVSTVTTVGPTIYLLHPQNHNYGAYTKGGAGLGTNGATNIIASGQGFFVLAANASAQLIFNESAKTTAQATGPALFMGMPADQVAFNPYIRLQMAKDSADSDDLLLRFNSSAQVNYVENEDAPYKKGFGKVSLSSRSNDSVDLAINALPLPKQNAETVGLTVDATADDIYQLSLKDINQVPQLFDVWLMDAYKKDSLDMRHNSTYSFNVLKGDSSSFGSKRFSLIIRQNPAYAFRLLNFTAQKINNTTQVQVAWKTENEQNYTNFTVERSIDNGATYEVLGGVSSSGLGSYNFLDKSPVIGQNLYRLKQEDINNTITYSKVVQVLYSDKSNNLAGNISIYPNPVNSTLNLAIASQSAESASYNIIITSSSGAVVKQAITNEPNWQGAVNNLLPGTYLVQVINNKDKSLVGNSKFIKI